MSIPFSEIKKRIVTASGEGPVVGVLATADARGVPSARCMVMRDLTNDGQMVFVSDRSTRKDAELRGQPECEIVFWLPKANVQIRVKGSAFIADEAGDDYFRRQWWHKLDPRGTTILSGERAAAPQEVEMPMTFEVILLNVTSVDIDDYACKPPVHEKYRA